MTFWTDLLGLAFEVKYVDAGGSKTRVLIAGEGEPVIFLHGLSGHLEAFIGSVRDITAAGFQTHLLDMLGHGFSGPLPGQMNPEMLADHVAAYMDAQGIEKAHIAGLSMGGWTAGWFASKYPERTITLQLISSVGDPDSKPAKDPAMGEWVRRMTREGVKGDHAATRARLEIVMSDPKMLTQEVVDTRYDIYHRPEFLEGLENMLGCTTPEDFTNYALTADRLAKISAETLVVWGELDVQMGGPNWLLAGIPKAKVIWFEGNGHWPQYEKPRDYALVAVAFMRQGLAGIASDKL